MDNKDYRPSWADEEKRYKFWPASLLHEERSDAACIATVVCTLDEALRLATFLDACFNLDDKI